MSKEIQLCYSAWNLISGSHLIQKERKKSRPPTEQWQGKVSRARFTSRTSITQWHRHLAKLHRGRKRWKTLSIGSSRSNFSWIIMRRKAQSEGLSNIVSKHFPLWGILSHWTPGEFGRWLSCYLRCVMSLCWLKPVRKLNSIPDCYR